MPTSHAGRTLVPDQIASANIPFIVTKENMPVVLIQTGTWGASEIGNIQRSYDQGVSFQTIRRGGALVQLKGSADRIIVIDFPGYYRVNKQLTTAEAGVVLVDALTPGSP